MSAKELFHLGVFSLNISAILAVFIKVFLDLLAGVGYYYVVTGFTLHSILSILKISLANSYQLISLT
jgi:hypothetical protein